SNCEVIDGQQRLASFVMLAAVIEHSLPAGDRLGLVLPVEARLAEFVDYYNTRRYHESLHNLTPADAYFGRGQAILKRRDTIRRETIELRRRLHHLATASTSTPMGQTLS